MKLVQLLAKENLIFSHAEGRRAIECGWVSFNGQKIVDSNAEVEPKSGDVIKRGKNEVILK